MLSCGALLLRTTTLVVPLKGTSSTPDSFIWETPSPPPHLAGVKQRLVNCMQGYLGASAACKLKFMSDKQDGQA